MILGQTWIIFRFGIALLQIGDLLAAGYYSSDQCQGTATTCSIPTPDQLARIAQALAEAGCTTNNTVAERQRFVDCFAKGSPQLSKNITELTNTDQQCRDEINFTFQQPGIVGECEIYGTPLAECFTRCAGCLRSKAFGFDPTELTIQQFKACKINQTSSYGS